MNKTTNMPSCGLLVLLVALAGSASAFEAGTLKWAFATGDDVVASPTIGEDGTIYIGSTDGNLYAINPNGTEKWSFTTGSDVWSSVAIADNDVLYFGSGDGNIYALDTDGREIWRFAMKAGTFSTPRIGHDGAIYVGSLDKNLYAINPDGTLGWAFPTAGTISSSPAIGADGSVYVGSADNHFYAINPDGSLQWSFDAGAWIDSPTLAADGTIYVGSVNFNLYAFTPTGQVAWTYRTQGAVWGSVALGGDGTLYFGSADGHLYALNPDGTKKWSFATGNWVNATPRVGPDGTIYVGSGDQHLYAVDADGNQKWAFAAGDPLFSSPAIGPDGTLYVGTWSGWDHNVYAIHGGRPSSGTIWVSTDDGLPFALEQVGDSIFGEGRLPDFHGMTTRMSLAGELTGSELTAPLVSYVGRSTTGDQDAPIVAGNRVLGEARLLLDPARAHQAVLDLRLGHHEDVYAGMSDADAIAWTYRLLFARDADPSGLAYYQAQLETGALPREDLMESILAGAVGDDAQTASELALSYRLTLVPAR